jgi:CubicO group peptidase (beta-lactamase class C family)
MTDSEPVPIQSAPGESAPPERRRLGRLVRRTQADARIPALSVALHRADRPLWTFQVGASGRADAPLGPDTLFRMGSITKTFTAVMVMQCRDEGRLELDDPIAAHLPVPAHGDLTIRRLLSHTAGLQREPYGDVWDTLQTPDAEQMLADLIRVERVLPPARRYHYSNLGLSLLGHMVGRLRGGTWEEVLADRILRPLKLDHVCVDPGERAAVGFLVDAYSDHARPEPPSDFGAVSPAGQLWASAADLARWAAFLVDPAAMDPAGAVLAPATMDEMRWPLTVTDETLWTGGFGLGLILVPQPEAASGSLRVMHVGHDGAMPGFLAGAYGRLGGTGTPGACGVAVLGSSGTATATVELPHQLLNAAIEDDPADVPMWTPGEAAPAPYRSILGRWWSEGFEFVFSWHDESLQARRVADPAGRPPAVFAPEAGETDLLRTVSGREAGELLRLDRDPGTGAVTLMHWATYRFTRTQETFDNIPVSDP